MFLKFRQELQRRVGVVQKEDLETGLGLHGAGSFSRHGGGEFSGVNKQHRRKVFCFFSKAPSGFRRTDLGS